MTRRPLAGLRVLDAATFLAAPFAATLLGEFGAEIIKIEQPGAGDPLRRFGTMTQAGHTLNWASESRNKKPITLDLRHPEGAALFKRLAADSDIVMENFRPGTFEKWGLGWDVLSALNPRLIMVRLSAFGQTGPYKDLPGFARIAHAFSGLGLACGEPGRVPVTPGASSLADYASGVWAAFATMVALTDRTATGRGQVIDLALYQATFRYMDEMMPAYAKTGQIRQRMGAETHNLIPHGHFRTADDRWLAIRRARPRRRRGRQTQNRSLGQQPPLPLLRHRRRQGGHRGLAGNQGLDPLLPPHRPGGPHPHRGSAI
jgi:crotonobetainyl-CoA:carnitine CoA-transferase CaiB-like acyl-CoA transferase